MFDPVPTSPVTALIRTNPCNSKAVIGCRSEETRCRSILQEYTLACGRHGNYYGVNLPHGFWPRISKRLFGRGRVNSRTFPAEWKSANLVWGRCCELNH